MYFPLDEILMGWMAVGNEDEVEEKKEKKKNFSANIFKGDDYEWYI